MSSLRGAFALHSSPVDWCEENWANGNFFAEFYNTISNVFFVLLPMASTFKMQKYCKTVDGSFWGFQILLSIVGIFSGYFHATLSFAGQLLDEWSILWINLYAVAAWCPDRWIEGFATRKQFKMYIVLLAVLMTPLALAHPAINAPMLLLFGGVQISMLIDYYPRTKSKTIKNLGKCATTVFLCAVICWVNDAVLCDFWKRTFSSIGLNYPQFHSFWHVGVATSSYASGVCFAFFKGEELGFDLTVEYFLWVMPWIEVAKTRGVDSNDNDSRSKKGD